MSDVHDTINSLGETAIADVHGITRDAFNANATTASEILIDFCRRQASKLCGALEIAPVCGPSDSTRDVRSPITYPRLGSAL